MESHNENLSKMILGAIVFVGYYIITIISMFIRIPTENVSIIMASISTIGPVVGMIAMSVWPKGSDSDRKTIQNLSEKVNPVTVPVENLTPVERVAPNDQQA